MGGALSDAPCGRLLLVVLGAWLLLLQGAAASERGAGVAWSQGASGGAALRRGLLQSDVSPEQVDEQATGEGDEIKKLSGGFGAPDPPPLDDMWGGNEFAPPAGDGWGAPDVPPIDDMWGGNEFDMPPLDKAKVGSHAPPLKVDVLEYAPEAPPMMTIPPHGSWGIPPGDLDREVQKEGESVAANGEVTAEAMGRTPIDTAEVRAQASDRPPKPAVPPYPYYPEEMEADAPPDEQDPSPPPPQWGAPAGFGNYGTDGAYGAPAKTYGQPNGIVKAPPSENYGAPAAVWGSPNNQTYGAPDVQWGAPQRAAASASSPTGESRDLLGVLAAVGTLAVLVSMAASWGARRRSKAAAAAAAAEKETALLLSPTSTKVYGAMAVMHCADQLPL